MKELRLGNRTIVEAVVLSFCKNRIQNIYTNRSD